MTQTGDINNLPPGWKVLDCPCGEMFAMPEVQLPIDELCPVCREGGSTILAKTQPLRITPPKGTGWWSN